MLKPDRRGASTSRRERTTLHDPHATDTTAFSTMVDALRRLQDDLTGAVPTHQAMGWVTRRLRELSTHLRPFHVDESRQIAGRLVDVPGRGQALVPVVHFEDDTRTTGRVAFGRYYLGDNGAVHGGAITLLFDELLGRLAIATSGDAPSRTAYLHVNYRSITPVGRVLRVECRLDRREGRKAFMVGVLLDGDTVCADAEGLFLSLLPGQP